MRLVRGPTPEGVVLGDLSGPSLPSYSSGEGKGLINKQGHACSAHLHTPAQQSQRTSDLAYRSPKTAKKILQNKPG